MKKKRGNPQLADVRNKDTRKANAKRKQLAGDHAKLIGKAMVDAQNERGHLNYGEYADWLNDEGYRTRRGHLWTGRQVSRIYARLMGANRPKNRV